MIAIEIDDEAAQKLLKNYELRLDEFPRKMGEAMSEWQVEDLHRDRPEADIMPDRRSVRTSKTRRRHARALRQLTRRLIGRALPRPIKMLRGRARRLARLQRKPERLITKLAPKPIKQYRKLARQVKGIAAGRQRPLGRAIRPLGRLQRIRRRAYMSANLMEALADKMSRLTL